MLWNTSTTWLLIKEKKSGSLKINRKNSVGIAGWSFIRKERKWIQILPSLSLDSSSMKMTVFTLCKRMVRPNILPRKRRSAYGKVRSKVYTRIWSKASIRPPLEVTATQDRLAGNRNNSIRTWVSLIGSVWWNRCVTRSPPRNSWPRRWWLPTSVLKWTKDRIWGLWLIRKISNVKLVLLQHAKAILPPQSCQGSFVYLPRE